MSYPNHSLLEKHEGLVDSCVLAHGNQHCEGSAVSLVDSCVQQVGQYSEGFLGGFLANTQTYWMEFDVHNVRIPIIHLLFTHLLFTHIFSHISLLARFLLFVVFLCLLW
jgi:hypothetical protein